MVGVSTSTETIPTGAYLRYRIVLSTLSGKSVRITNIHSEDSNTPGLSPSEISFIRLIDKITSGSSIQINETGTALFYKPGLIIGGDRLSHECHPSRAISYYLEALLMLAPFAKHPISISLRGSTHSQSDICIDTVAAVSIPLLRRLTLGTPLNASLDVRKRGIASGKANGGGRGGSVHFRCGIAKAKLKAIELTQAGYVKRIRGIAFANRVSPGHISRMVDATRAILNRFTPDVYIHTDHNNHAECGIGFGLHLVAETTEGCLTGADWCSIESNTTPEQVARSATSMLLEEIDGGGCVDVSNACLSLLYCAMGDSDVNRVRIGRLNEGAVEFLRDIRRFLGVVFKIEVADVDSDSEEEDLDDKVVEGGTLMSCIGVGVSNVARQRF